MAEAAAADRGADDRAKPRAERPAVPALGPQRAPRVRLPVAPPGRVAVGGEDHLPRCRLDGVRAEPDRRHPRPRVAARHDHARADGHRPGAPAHLRDRRPARCAGARRPRRHRGDDRPPRGARRCRLRLHDDAGRRLQAGHGHRLRAPEALRVAADDRGHPRHRRNHARAADDPGPARHLQGDGGALPGCAPAAVREPDGDELLGGHAGIVDQHRRAVPLRTAHCRAARPRPTGACGRGRLPLRRDQPRRLLPPARAPRRGSLPAVARDGGRRSDPGLEPGALRGVPPLRLLPDRVFRALRRVLPLVHQGRPARSDRGLQHPARRVSRALRAADRRVAGAAGGRSSSAVR